MGGGDRDIVLYFMNRVVTSSATSKSYIGGVGERDRGEALTSWPIESQWALLDLQQRVVGHYREKTNTDLWSDTTHTHTNTPVQTPVSHSPNISGHLTLHRRGWVLFVFAGLHSHHQGSCSFASLPQNSL